MRRTDKEITDHGIIARIIENSQVCRLGLAKDNIPYVLPVSFGYDGSALYFHTAREGRKIDFIAANPYVCFEFEHDCRVVPHEKNACNWTASFRSVIGYGTVHELLGPSEKAEALQRIMEHYASSRDWSFDGAAIAATRVWKIAIESISGKQSKDKCAP